VDIKLVLIGVFAFFAILVAVLVLYFLWRRFSSLVKFEKTAQNGKSRVFFQTFIPAKRVVIEDNVDGEPILFVREDMKPGDKLELLYPLSQAQAKLTVEGDENFSLEASLRA